MQCEITSFAPLLDQNGALARRGYARRMLFGYDRRAIKASPFSVKEWDFYQISDDKNVLQLTVGHVSYMASASANLFNLQTGEKRSCSVMKPLPFGSLGMESDPEKPHEIRFEQGGFSMRFDVKSGERHLTLDAKDRTNGNVSVDILLTNCAPEKEKLVIATPFSKPNRFYLNYKENCCFASGEASFGDETVSFGGGAFGLLDWGRGVWPFRHEWVWGNGSALAGGNPFGFNLGWGFGDTSAATENMVFYDGRASKLGTVHCEPVDGEGYMAVKRYFDDEGRFDFTAAPVFDNFTKTKLLFVDNTCHQVFSRWNGFAVLDDGTTLEVIDMTAFCEHAKNRW